jgi:hypothetical protein
MKEEQICLILYQKLLFDCVKKIEFANFQFGYSATLPVSNTIKHTYSYSLLKFQFMKCFFKYQIIIFQDFKLDAVNHSN